MTLVTRSPLWAEERRLRGDEQRAAHRCVGLYGRGSEMVELRCYDAAEVPCAGNGPWDSKEIYYFTDLQAGPGSTTIAGRGRLCGAEATRGCVAVIDARTGRTNWIMLDAPW